VLAVEAQVSEKEETRKPPVAFGAIGAGIMDIGLDGLPVNLIFLICDEFLVHGPTKHNCGEGFSAYMDHTL
jgi:hypothetical protein